MDSKTVLVVEDNEMNMKLTVALLKIGKYRILEARDAETGLSLARIHRPALILMDIQLPRMDGLTAARQIRKDPALKRIPIVALTAHAMQGDDHKAIEAGCAGYIAKPIDTHTFLDAIKQFMMQRSDKIEAPLQHQAYRSKIMLVDDDPLNHKLIAARLPSDRYAVTAASSGEEALRKIAESAPDLVLLDIMMPGMSGFEVAKRIKNDPATRDIPIIMVTALDDDESKMRSLEAGADEFLNKPVNPAELSVRIKSLINLKQYREQLKSRDDKIGYFLEQDLSSRAKENPGSVPLVLLVENDEREAETIEMLLQGEPYTIKRVASVEDAITLASDEEVSLVLMDTLLPNMSGVEVCRRLKEAERTRATPVIFISSPKDLETKAQGMEAGADDFLVKPINQYELRARVKALLSKKSHMDRLNLNAQNDLHAVITDKLTGLYNQAYFTHFTDIEVKRSRRNKQPVILVRVEIDDFKTYKGTLGLWAGDLLMKELGQLMKGNFREIDLIARCDREGFGVLMPYTDLKGASQALDRLREAIKGHLFLRGTALPPKRLTVSMGISGYPWSAATVSELIQNANQALSAAKRDGKNRISVHQSENQQVEKGASGSQTPYEAPGGTEYH